MKKGILIGVFICVYSMANAQWPQVGAKWWYQNNEETVLFLVKRAGYAVYECTKDSLVNDTLYFRIDLTKYYTNDTIKKEAPFYVFKVGNVVYYKFANSSVSYFLHHLNPVENHTFTGLFKGVSCNNNSDTLLMLRFTEITSSTISGNSVTTYRLEVPSNNSLSIPEFYNRVGNSYTFLPSLFTNEVFDCTASETNTLRCYENTLAGTSVKFTNDCEKLIIPFIQSTSNTDYKEFYLYPNPWVKIVPLKVHSNTVLEGYEFKIINSQGQELPIMNSVELENYAHTLNKGIYYVQCIKNGKILFTNKLVVL